MGEFNRISAKAEAKQYLKENPYIQKLYLIVTICTVLSNILDVGDNDALSALSWVVSLAGTIVGISVLFKMMDIRRKGLEEEYNNYSYGELLTESLYIFKNTEYLIPLIVASLLSAVFIALGFILLIIPGVLLAIGYSQISLLVKDRIDNGDTLSAMGYLSESRVIMKGNYGDYFVLVLSFLGWSLLSAITFGLFNYFLIPYRDYVMVSYFNYLTK